MRRSEFRDMSKWLRERSYTDKRTGWVITRDVLGSYRHDGMTDNDIMKHLDMPEDEFRDMVKYLDEKYYTIKRTGFLITQQHLDKMRHWGYKWIEIASILGISAIYLRQIRRKLR